MTEQEKRDRIRIAEVDGAEVAEEHVAARIEKMNTLRRVYQGLVNDHTSSTGDFIGVACMPVAGDTYHVQIGLTQHGRTFVNTLSIDWDQKMRETAWRETQASRVARIVNEIVDAVIDRAAELKRARSTTRRRRRPAKGGGDAAIA